MDFLTDNIKTILPLIGTLVGVLVGWLLNELRDHFKVKRENRKIINSILFTLLEIRFVLTKTKLDDFIPSLVEFLQKSFPGEDIKSIQPIINQMFNIFLQKELSEKLGNDIGKIEAKYNDSIKELASIEPILAYSISGKTQLYNYLEFLEDYTGKVDELFKMELNNTEEAFNFNSLKEVLTNSVQPILYNEALQTVTDDILQVSRKIGLRYYFSTKKVIKRQDSLIIADELENLLGGHLKVMLTPLTQSMSN
ncbi:hypothetical protein [Marinoscillum pacificum]|uniref:hypothetical protein n=1 Tax=Marinoscillum pacificum TaxID=392723 RepID=UPI002157679D|nr:hypothetical protein [Marinoscillum pacificum]